ncbi:hypothetical protein IRT45_32010 [Nocardia sp. BSTN01]|nr:hypothetical protein [Nocardia sp. BSTN01]
MDSARPWATSASTTRSPSQLEIIAAGEAIAIAAGFRIHTLRPDLTAVPLTDVDPAHVVLATRADDHTRLVAAFRKTAQAVLTGPNPES